MGHRLDAELSLLFVSNPVADPAARRGCGGLTGGRRSGRTGRPSPARIARPPTLRAQKGAFALRAKLLSQMQFDEALAQQRLRVAFVGMSNCGKSFRSTQLAEALGFQLSSVDAEIEKHLHTELQALGHQGIGGIAKWMGFPYEGHFREREARYLQLEEQLTSSASLPSAANFALDTTGSVVYLSESCRRQLSTVYLVVHLEATDEMLGEMIERYFQSPKPVIWGPLFSLQPEDEGDGQRALRRCYPHLLRWRRQRYRELADVNLAARVSLAPDIGPRAFMEHVRALLPTGGAPATGR